MKRYFTRILVFGCCLLFGHYAHSQEVRTLNGSMNNPNNPGWGAVNAHLLRMAANGYADGVAAPAGADRPNPRVLSNMLFPQNTLENDPRGLSAYAWAWGQFIDHDITLVPDNKNESLPIVIPPYDFFFDPQGSGNVQIPFLRSEYDPATGLGQGNPRKHINKISAFIDGSAVYGSDMYRAIWLRMYSRGKLKLSDNGLLPYNTVTGEYNAPIDQLAPEMAMPLPFVEKWFVAGDDRANENPLLTSLHNLFVREHNRISVQLHAEHPDWTDDDLYQAARRRVGALMQAITFEEWLPALGVHLPEYTGYQADVNPGIMNVFSAAAFRYGHTTINSVLLRMDAQGHTLPEGNILLRDAFFNPGAIREVNGIEPYLLGMSTLVQQDFDCKVIDDLRNFLFGPPGAGGMDLAAINIQRGRDRGLPDYNAIRAEFGMPAAEAFTDITKDPLMSTALQSIYQDINAIDPWVGMLSEDHMPDALFGPTAMAIVSRQFLALRDGDRFYYENDPVFSPDDIAEIKQTRLADIIRRNTSITTIGDQVFVASPLGSSSLVSGDAPADAGLTVYPNPVVDQTVFLRWVATDNRPAVIRVLDALGQPVLTRSAEQTNGWNQAQIALGSELPPGAYVVVVQTGYRVYTRMVARQ